MAGLLCPICNEGRRFEEDTETFECCGVVIGYDDVARRAVILEVIDLGEFLKATEKGGCNASIL